MRLSAIIVAAAAMLSAVPVVAVAQRGEVVKVTPDATGYKCGQYQAYPAPWSTTIAGKPEARLVRGIDYSDSITMLPSNATKATCLDGATIAWSWPSTTSSQGVYGYMELAFGNYDGGVVANPVPPVQVSAMKTFTEQVQVARTTGARTNFNILTEFYLTTRSGVAKSKIVEIGFFLNGSDGSQSYFAKGAACGTYTDLAGNTWSCRWMRGGSSAKYVMFYAGKPVLNTTIDFKAVIALVVSQGLARSSYWVNGSCLGVEPLRGSGTITVSHFAVTLN